MKKLIFLAAAVFMLAGIARAESTVAILDWCGEPRIEILDFWGLESDVEILD